MTVQQPFGCKLSTRSYNCLLNLGIASREALSATVVEAGGWRAFAKTVPNLGKKSVAEMQALLEPPPESIDELRSELAGAQKALSAAKAEMQRAHERIQVLKLSLFRLGYEEDPNAATTARIERICKESDRLLSQGLTLQQAAERMGYGLEYLKTAQRERRKLKLGPRGDGDGAGRDPRPTPDVDAVPGMKT
jgi:hypothetical protein